jgi:hypothetical protein
MAQDGVAHPISRAAIGPAKSVVLAPNIRNDGGRQDNKFRHRNGLSKENRIARRRGDYNQYVCKYDVTRLFLTGERRITLRQSALQASTTDFT